MSDTLRNGLAAYLDSSGLSASYDGRWVSLPLGPIELTIPNSETNVRATRVHDLHHVLTGYAADATGELEISAWEVGSGATGSMLAWAIDHALVVLGAFMAPKRTFLAFVRGRRSTNLYGHPLSTAVAEGDPAAPLLDRPVDEVAALLGLRGSAVAVGTADRAAFVGALAIGFAVGCAVVPFLPIFAVAKRLW